MSSRISQALHVTGSSSCRLIYSQKTASTALIWCRSICQVTNWEVEISFCSDKFAPFYAQRLCKQLYSTVWSYGIKQFQESRFNTSHLYELFLKFLSLGVPRTHNPIVKKKYSLPQDRLSKHFVFNKITIADDRETTVADPHTGSVNTTGNQRIQFSIRALLYHISFSINANLLCTVIEYARTCFIRQTLCPEKAEQRFSMCGNY